jgi:hypothetical protein
LLVAGWGLTTKRERRDQVLPPVRPEPAAAELGSLLPEDDNRVLEAVRYIIRPPIADRFLAAMDGGTAGSAARGRRVERRSMRTVAHPERWVELWAIESWDRAPTRGGRLTEDDLASLSRARAFHAGEAPPEAARYVNVPV